MITKNETSEQFCLHDSDAFMAIPIFFTGSDSDVNIEVFPSLYEEAVRFEESFRGRYFSPDAISYLKEHFASPAIEKGYAFNHYADGYLIGFQTEKANEALILPSTERLQKKHLKLDCLVDYDPESLLEYETAFVTVADGAIVSIATITQEEENEYQLGVETAEAYRRRGYGLSNVSAAIRFFEKKKEKLVYDAESANAASIGLIEKAGGRPFRKAYTMIMTRENGENEDGI